MMNKFIFFFISVLFCNFINGQVSTPKSIDSLWSLVKNEVMYNKEGSKEMLRLYTEMYYQSKNIHYERGELRSIMKMSEIYSNEGNYKECVNKIAEGLILAEKLKNYVNWSNLLILQSGVYTELGYFEKAKNNFAKCLLIADKISTNDEKHLIKASLFRHIAYNIDKENVMPNKFDSVLFYYQKAYAEANKLGDKFPGKKEYISRNAKNIGSLYLIQNKIAEAEKYLNEFESLTKNNRRHPNYISFFILKGQIENKKKDYKKGIEYFNKSILLSKEFKILPTKLIESYSGIAESYEGMHDYENQAAYLAKVKKLSDSLAKNNTKIIEKVGSSINKEKVINYSIFYILGIVVLIMIISFLLRKNRYTKEKNILNNEKDDKLILTDTEIETTILSGENNKNKDIDFKYLSDIIELAQHNDQSFLIKFLDLFPTFNQSLLNISTHLTPTDLEYCALIKLNFDTKQIATLKKISIGSVESRKYRIRKKLNINNSENIYTWMTKI
ncbi:tetratricopeptide repeat protein [Chryseobacterium sp. SIMBA_029]|uniref:tetratricopeptide repeat protein n=2 Tax=unclassified Chryseobacterium TaxID=2593645 RepID=UPI00397B3FAB